jgi:RNA polymerase-binding transcription factor DksA
MNTARRLTRAQLRDLADDLRSQRARLERSIAMRMEASDVAPAAENHLRGHSPAEGGLATALEARTLDRHEQLDSALRRLEAGTYGVCVSCHRPIAYARLLVMPEATHCVGCGSGA